MSSSQLTGKLEPRFSSGRIEYSFKVKPFSNAKALIVLLNTSLPVKYNIPQ
jgi:hypothetical protein